MPEIPGRLSLKWRQLEATLITNRPWLCQFLVSPWGPRQSVTPREAMEDSSLELQGDIGVGKDSGRWSSNCPLREEFSVH